MSAGCGLRMTHACTTCCTWCATASRDPRQQARRSVRRDAFSPGSAPDAYHTIVGALRTRRTIAALTRLDDHLLCDIGIDREQIPMIAQGLIAPSGEAPRRELPAAPCPRAHLREAANEPRPLSVAA